MLHNPKNFLHLLLVTNFKVCPTCLLDQGDPIYLQGFPHFLGSATESCNVLSVVSAWSSSEISTTGFCTLTSDGSSKGFIAVFTSASESEIISKHVYADYPKGLVCNTLDSASPYAFCLGASAVTLDLIKIDKTTKAV